MTTGPTYHDPDYSKRYQALLGSSRGGYGYCRSGEPIFDTRVGACLRLSGHDGCAYAQDWIVMIRTDIVSIVEECVSLVG